MPWWEIVLVLTGTLLAFAAVHALSKSKRPFKRALLSMCIGLATLLAVHFTASFTGVDLPLSLLSILTSVIGGVPGVTLMLVLRLFF